MSGLWSKITGLFKPKATEDAVYFLVELDRPLRGITKTEPRKPWIKVTGVTFEDAVSEYFGRSINWHTVPMNIRASLELGEQSAEMTEIDFSRIVKG